MSLSTTRPAAGISAFCPAHMQALQLLRLVSPGAPPQPGLIKARSTVIPSMRSAIEDARESRRQQRQEQKQRRRYHGRPMLRRYEQQHEQQQQQRRQRLVLAGSQPPWTWVAIPVADSSAEALQWLGMRRSEALLAHAVWTMHGCREPILDVVERIKLKTAQEATASGCSPRRTLELMGLDDQLVEELLEPRNAWWMRHQPMETRAMAALRGQMAKLKEAHQRLTGRVAPMHLFE